MKTKKRLIETDDFPFDFLSLIAERESWRKEIYRPIYHAHKWWAKRLGSIFRGIILGCKVSEDIDLKCIYYEKNDETKYTVFDPFMGSGTTIGEAHKLGCIALGQDINPVACESVRVSLGDLNRDDLEKAFITLSRSVGKRIRSLYTSKDKAGNTCDVLYYFWVKIVDCPQCNNAVDLFSSRIFVKNAYPKKKPEVQVCCPYCSCIYQEKNGHEQSTCPECQASFDPKQGNAKGAKAECPACSEIFSIKNTVQTIDTPPAHRMYAKLVLMSNGEKCYLAVTDEDIQQYEKCHRRFKRELARGSLEIPTMTLEDGFNTKQAIGYNYHKWSDFFNARQLLSLGWLQREISKIENSLTRDGLLTLFSGVLEFNNMFTSYKGEGTGAVRHMFSHHILKPERTPIEANVWGTGKSSGSFMTLFNGRIRRLLDYRDSPFEVKIEGKGKSYGGSFPFEGEVHSAFPKDGKHDLGQIYLNCGSSDQPLLLSKSIDAVVTDPPFFDNVHYSELADFFYAWQSLYPRGFLNGAKTTRHSREVQDADSTKFSDKLQSVFGECHRVLKDKGLLVFTYHHSRQEGWIALAKAVCQAGFVIVNAHPVKAEMSVATPKAQAKEPIQLDIIIVCKKRINALRSTTAIDKILKRAIQKAIQKASRLTKAGFRLSKGDRRVITISQFLAEASSDVFDEESLNALEEAIPLLENAADKIEEQSSISIKPVSRREHQTELLFEL